jgi:hypothetical protein
MTEDGKRADEIRFTAFHDLTCSNCTHPELATGPHNMEKFEQAPNSNHLHNLALLTHPSGAAGVKTFPKPSNLWIWP